MSQVSDNVRARVYSAVLPSRRENIFAYAPSRDVLKLAGPTLRTVRHAETI